jgi:hypothetical protein
MERGELHRMCMEGSTPNFEELTLTSELQG